MAKKVVQASLFDSFHVVNVGSFKATLPPDNHSLKNFRMVLEDNGMLVLMWDNASGQPQEFGLGVSMIKTVRFAAADKA